MKCCCRHLVVAADADADADDGGGEIDDDWKWRQSDLVVAVVPRYWT